MGDALNFDYVDLSRDEDNTLLGVLDRLLDAGVVVSGDLKISVANVDLLEVGLKVMLASTDTAERWRAGQSADPEHRPERRLAL